MTSFEGAKVARSVPIRRAVANSSQIKSIINEIDREEDARKFAVDTVRSRYSGAKGNGDDVKPLRTMMRLRKMNPNNRAEQEKIVDTYMQAGML
jgi:uncharacterized protein (UPF0335 family)